MILAINMYGKFIPREIFVEGGHRTEPTSSIICSGVVSIDSARLGFLLALSSDLDTYSVDIGDVDLNSE